MPIRPTTTWLRGGRVRDRGKRPKRRHGGGAHRLDDWGIGRRPALLHDSTPASVIFALHAIARSVPTSHAYLAHRRVGQLKRLSRVGLPASISLTRPRQRRASRRPILANSTAASIPMRPSSPLFPHCWHAREHHLRQLLGEKQTGRLYSWDAVLLRWSPAAVNHHR
ncbi:hypothetical protein IQ07DRAFT_595491 [Pyrenochaeta sp. DS3sAY3a]|nr:hypothetical protein IQ07DRAFT_595491 [Pyrenochaeta sp. DS3sAY3a]